MAAGCHRGPVVDVSIVIRRRVGPGLARQPVPGLGLAHAVPGIGMRSAWNLAVDISRGYVDVVQRTKHGPLTSAGPDSCRFQWEVVITVLGCRGQGRGRGLVGIFASTSAVEPAARVSAASVRSRKRCNDSPSPRGTVASRRSLTCTSGRSKMASTRLARLPAVLCPDAGCSDARAVRPPRADVVTSAAATV